MDEFIDSTALFDDPEAMRDRFLHDGYLLLRAAVAPGMLTDVRRDIVEVLDRHDWLAPDVAPMDAVPRVEPRVEGEELYFAVYDDIQRLESFHAVPHHPSVRRCVTPLLGDDAFPHPLSVARLSFPGSDEWTTPPHQDFPNNQGTTELFACWMPLGDCPLDLGPLRILRGSHRLGLLPLEASLGAGFRRAQLGPEHEQLEWVGGDLALGDVLVFHSLTVHASLRNRTDRLRLSVDYRFQGNGDTLTEACLEPHFGRLTWDEIYAGWQHEDLQYYWRDKHYEVAPWDDTPFAVSDEDFARQMREFFEWREQHPPVS